MFYAYLMFGGYSTIKAGVRYSTSSALEFLMGGGKLAFSGGTSAELFLATLFDVSTENTGKYFSTSLGGRYVDVYKDGIAHESKVGYTYLTDFVKKQVLKDYELKQDGVIDGVVCHFFRSADTGKVGASEPLLRLLDSCGIKYIIHD
ncbi:hypothetical protein [Tumebacillus flagellatus]|uniref:hypothetical protein n=1 Tax=Tumebacillus flagellatus TaxID=1157490 RepID=UPI001267E5DD|nr:hypothetical protein [Tumebacillus flagellatus]